MLRCLSTDKRLGRLGARCGARSSLKSEEKRVREIAKSDDLCSILPTLPIA